MCEAKFTKGEWKIFNDRVGVIDDSDTQSYGMMLEVAYVDMYNFGDAEGKANAYLIAAAPEMYEENENQIAFLRKFIDIFHVNSREAMDVSDRIDAILSVQAKARGEHV